MRTYEPRSLDDLLARFEGLSDSRNRAICRGQCEATWPLQPSLDRLVPAVTPYLARLTEELSLVDEFRCRAEHLLGEIEWRFVLREPPSDRILPMTVMQHFGVPTRLLDWTKSPWIAAFFAGVGADGADGAVWWYNESALASALEKQWRRLKMKRTQTGEIDYNEFAFREKGDEFVGPVYLILPFARAQAQQGLFTIGGTLGQNHDQPLSRLLGEAQFGKLIVPSGFKRQLLDELRVRGVSASALQHAGADRLGFDMAAELKCKRLGAVSMRRQTG